MLLPCYNNTCKTVCFHTRNRLKKILYNMLSKNVEVMSSIQDAETPKVSDNLMYIGTVQITTDVRGFKDLTADHITNLQKIELSSQSQHDIAVHEYQLIVIAVPKQKKVFVTDVIVGEQPFYVNVSDAYGNGFYSNGENTIFLDTDEYALYGMFCSVDGLIRINIK